MNRDQESVKNEINELIPSILDKCYSQDISTISIRFSLLVLKRYWYISNSEPINNLQKAAHMEFCELGYEDSVINKQLSKYFSNETNVVNAIRRLFPLDISILCSKVCGVAELLCICYGISTKYKKHLFYEIRKIGDTLTLRLKCMEDSYNTLQRALSSGELKYAGSFISGDDYRQIKLIDVVNWRKKKVSIYCDFCVPFDKSAEETIMLEARIDGTDWKTKYEEENDKLRKEEEEYKRNIEKYEQEIKDLKEILTKVQNEKDANSKNLSSWSLILQSFITKFIPNFNKDTFLFTEDAFFKKEFIVNGRKCSIKQILIEITKEQTGKNIDDETIKAILETIRIKARNRQGMKA